jgi:hypothetical protein
MWSDMKANGGIECFIIKDDKELEFKYHDLSRTMEPRASEVGIDYLMIKRMLNHKSNNITGQYIQRNSIENLLAVKKALESITY